MTIGIDIDDTICDSYEYMTPYFCNAFNIDIKSLENKFGRYYEVYGLTREEFKKFLLDNFYKFSPNIKVKENAKEVINRLKQNNKIIIVTARSDDYFKDAKKHCIDYLNKKNILFDEVIVNAKEKGKICKENNIDLLIDDNIDNCKSAKGNGIKCLLFDSKINKNTDEFIRVHNWIEIEKIIENEVK